MKVVKITLSFNVKDEDLEHKYVKEFISSAKSGKMKKEVEESAAMGETPIENIKVECQII